VLLDAPLQPDGRLLKGEFFVRRLSLPGVRGKYGLRDHSNRGGGQGTAFHRRRTDVGRGNPDEITA
jgi:hypothetical protein